MNEAPEEYETPPQIGRTPPQDMAAEQAVIGSLLLKPALIDDVADVMAPRDHYRPAHETIHATIAAMWAKGEPIDVLTVVDRLRADGTLAKVGGPIAVYDLTAATVVPDHGVHHAEIVARCAVQRRLIEAGQKVIQIGHSPDFDDNALEDARATLDAAAVKGERTRAQTLAETLVEVIDIAEHGQAGMLGTPWPDLDRLIGGIAPGRLVTFAARPGVGKSLAMLNIARHVAEHHGHAALLASMEMPRVEVVQRLLADMASVNLTDLMNGTVDEKAWGRIARRTDELSGLSLQIDDTPKQTVGHIRKAARDVMRTRSDLALIAVDYLQLMAPDDGQRGRVEQVSQITRDLKLLARETGACVVVAAQLNRESAKRQDPTPVLTDLRESGSIEQDSDQVVLMWQPDEALPDLPMVVAKNRHGQRGHATVQIQGHYARLVSAMWTPTGGKR